MSVECPSPRCPLGLLCCIPSFHSARYAMSHRSRSVPGHLDTRPWLSPTCVLDLVKSTCEGASSMPTHPQLSIHGLVCVATSVGHTPLLPAPLVLPLQAIQVSSQAWPDFLWERLGPWPSSDLDTQEGNSLRASQISRSAGPVTLGFSKDLL